MRTNAHARRKSQLACWQLTVAGVGIEAVKMEVGDAVEAHRCRARLDSSDDDPKELPQRWHPTQANPCRSQGERQGKNGVLKLNER
ncbi:MAG: hypothetical protein NOOUEUKL_002493 [Candidatus Fervidibacter sp.]